MSRVPLAEYFSLCRLPSRLIGRQRRCFRRFAFALRILYSSRSIRLERSGSRTRLPVFSFDFGEAWPPCNMSDTVTKDADRAETGQESRNQVEMIREYRQGSSS